MSSLEGKKILFFAPKFFNYEVEICKEIEKQGGIVRFYDERNNPSSIEKILLRKAHFVMTHKINSYYKRISIQEKKFNPDYVLFISPETINRQSIVFMRECFQNAKFILYMWDSLENKNAKKVYSFFDKCLSFDKQDCNKYGFIFRPLFFIPKFEQKFVLKKHQYDFAFVGSIHSDRTKILNRLKSVFQENNLNFFYYLYVPGKLMFFLRILIDSDFRKLKSEGFVHLKAISKEDISNIIDDSNYIIDINHPKQIGLTMRTIEMIGAHKKLLTTNNHISEYDFFNSSNQIVVERDSIRINKEHLIDGYSEISEEIYDKYKISSWLKDLFAF